MQCSKLDIEIDVEKLSRCLQPYADNILKVASLFPNDITRVMTNYPSGGDHYTMKKRADEDWERIETEDYTLLTRFTVMHTRMVSVYFNEQKTVDKYIEDVIIAIRQNQNIDSSKRSVIALVYAGPKFRLEKHIDSKGLVRYHIPLIASNDSYFETYDPYNKYYPKVGEVWRLETHIPHAAQNDDKENYRIHVIIDFI